MQPTTEDTLLYSVEATHEDLGHVNRTEKPPAFYPPALPPGWTYEKFLNLRTLYDIRMVLCGIGVFTNSLILLLQLKLKTYKKPQLIFALVLTASDAISCPAIFMQTYYYRNNYVNVPLLYQIIANGTTVMSALVIIAVAFDRYLALCAFPLQYKVLVNPRKYTFVVIAMCVISMVYGCIFGWNFTLENFLSTAFIHFIVSITLVGITTIIYLFVSFSVSRSRDQLSLPVATKNVRIRQTRRIMLAFGLIQSTNIIFTLPQTFFALYIIFQPIGQGYYLFKNNLISNWLYNIHCLNYTLNPLIYWWQMLFREFSLLGRKSTTKLKADDGVAAVSTKELSKIPTHQ